MLKSFEVILFLMLLRVIIILRASQPFKKVPLIICIRRQIASHKAAYRPENQVSEMDNPEIQTKKIGPSLYSEHSRDNTLNSL